MPSQFKRVFSSLLIIFPLLCESQTHEYIFNNNLNELNGGPGLTEILACGAAAGAYGVQTAGTTGGACLTSNSFCFNDGGGLQYPNQGLITGSFTINMFFRFSTLGGWARVIDFSNSTSDAGVYFLGNCLNFYPNGNIGTCPYFNTNTYYLITFVRDGGSNIISVYVDGTLFSTYNDSGNLYRPASGTVPINFFRDDNPVPCENQPGCVKYISVSPTLSTASDVALLWNNITTVIQATTAVPPTVTISPTGSFTCSNNSVILSASSSGTMVWNGGSLSNSGNPATINATGTYIVTATDANGCMDTAMVTVASNTTVPTVTASSSGNLGCSNTSVTLTGNSTGNTMVWNGGSLSNASNPATVTTAGTYTVTATDAVNGCTNTASITVTSDTAQALITIVNSSTICAGQTTTLTATGGTTYLWSTGATTNSITISPASTISYTVTGTTNGCSDDTVATVTVNPLPVITVNSPAICSGQTATLTAGGGTTYLWSTGATTNSITDTPSATTSYTVTGTTSGCSDTAIATVTVGGNLSITVNSPSICAGETATLTANGGSTYSWSTGDTINPVTVNPASSTTYTVTGTSGGCSGTAIATVTVGGSLVITVNSPTICTGEIATLTASGGTTYLWSTGDTSNAITDSPTTDTSYTVIGTTAGCSDTATSIVTVNPLPVITVNAATICAGDTATLSALGGTTYSWSTGATVNPIIVMPSTTTTFTVTGFALTCSSTEIATVTVNPIPVVTVNSPGICVGGIATLTAAGATTYLWSTGATSNPISESPALTTTYTVLGATSGCSDTAIATVTVNPFLSVSASGAASICIGSSATITANAINGSGGPYTYSWAPGITNTSSSVIVSPIVTTTFTVTANDGCSPAATDSITITVLPAPTVAFISDVNQGCATLCVNFTDQSTVAGGNIVTQNWDFGAEGSNPQYCYTDQGQYSITLTVISNSGCISTFTNTNMITVSPFPSASFTGPLSTGILEPTVNFTDNSSGATLWNWNFGDTLSTNSGNTSNLQNPSHTYSEVGTYCVILIVGNASGCYDTTQSCLEIYPEFSFYIPNSFSPDGNGKNDEFYGKGGNIKDFNMQIYDRWGNLVFYADNIDKHWDGRINRGTEIGQEDVYVYVINILDNKRKAHKYIGNVTIVK